MDQKLLCSECFFNAGLRMEAAHIGDQNDEPCQNCSSRNGRGLKLEALQQLMTRFFVGALKTLDEQRDRTAVAKVALDILSRCSEARLEPGQRMYRIRTNPERIENPLHIDTPPSQFDASKKPCGRFESAELPVLYTSSVIETALHESRVRLGDEIVLGTLQVSKEQKLVDLDVVKEHVEGGLNLNADCHYFLRARLGSQEAIDYRICQILAVEARLAGFDGFKFRSFYSILLQNYETSVNYALFGFPIKEERVSLISWNSIRLLKASYELQFGPLLHTLWKTEP